LAYLERSKEAATLKEVGRGYMLLGSATDAARVAAKLKELQPQGAAGYALAAEAAYKLGRMEDSVEDAKRALKINPKDSNTQTLLRFAETQLGRGKASAGAPPKTANVAARPQAAEFERRRGGIGDALNRLEHLKTDQGLNRLFRTKSGRKLMVEVIPGADAETTLKTLQEKGVDVRTMDSTGGQTQKVFKEGDIYVIVIPREAFKESPSAVAPVLGQGMSEVQDLKEQGEGFSIVLIKQKAQLIGIRIWEEVKSTGEGCDGNGWLCQTLNLASRIWKDNFSENPPRDGEFSDPEASQKLKKAESDELKSGLRGTDEILKQTNDKHKMEDMGRVKLTEEYEQARDEALRKMKQEDEQFRRETGNTIRK
ncbi:MAG: hypothetical protein AAB576_11395, partial [Elusimicrobiota bacterium]